jgi:hypothetical protein
MSFSTLLTLVFVPVMYEILDVRRHAADHVPAREPAYGYDAGIGTAEGRAGD